MTHQEMDECPVGSIIKQPERYHNINIYTKERNGGWRESNNAQVHSSAHLSQIPFELVANGPNTTHLQNLVQALIDSAEQSDDNLKQVLVDSKALLLLAEALEINSFHFVAE